MALKIELPEQTDNENPYFETPDISELMPVIFPGGGGGASGGAARLVIGMIRRCQEMVCCQR